MRITKHAKIRMDERNMTHQMIADVIANGTKLVNRTDPNKWTYVWNGPIDLYVVTNKESDVVITVWVK